MKIAIITAMAEETLPIYKKMGNVTDEKTVAGVIIKKIELKSHILYLATSGIGEIRAAMTAQLLIDLYSPDIVLNFGFVGALDTELKIGELTLVKAVCHHQFDTSGLDGASAGVYDGKVSPFFYTDTKLLELANIATGDALKNVIVASGDKFIASGTDKKYLKETFSADICEMEAAAIYLVCERNNIPALSIKVVSDSADENASTSFTEAVEKGLTGYENIIPGLLTRLEKFDVAVK